MATFLTHTADNTVYWFCWSLCVCTVCAVIWLHSRCIDFSSFADWCDSLLMETQVSCCRHWSLLSGPNCSSAQNPYTHLITDCVKYLVQLRVIANVDVLFVCWQRTFMALDADRNGHFNKREFHHALITLGLYHLNVIQSFYSYVQKCYICHFENWGEIHPVFIRKQYCCYWHEKEMQLWRWQTTSSI